MEMAHKICFRLMEILKVCPNVDEQYRCHTAHLNAHKRCVDLMVLLAEITNLPEYLVYLGNDPETKTDPYGFITSYPPAEALIAGTKNNDEKVVDLE
jgi:hypothetical protein